MSRFMTRYEEVEAVQIPFMEMEAEFLHNNADVIFKRENGVIVEVIINTLEGTTVANRGDWITKNHKGELHRYKPNIFEETYEPIND